MILLKPIFISGMAMSLLACGGGSSPAGNVPVVTTSSSASTTTTTVTTVATTTTTSAPTNDASFTLSSSSFANDATLPIKLTCVGGDTSPNLQWSIVSDAVKSFAVIIDDPDAQAMFGHTWVHWNVYNVGANVRQLAEGASLTAMPSGSVEGTTDFGSAKYLGPCPPAGSGIHHYHFALYALNKETIAVDLLHSTTRVQFEAAHSNDIVKKVEIIGTYSQ